MKGLEGKVAVVAAASSGIGKGIAKVLSRHGCRVYIFSRNAEKIKKTAEEISSETGKKVWHSATDLSKKGDLMKMLEDVHSSIGPIDFLILNYGDPKVAPFMELTEEDWDNNIDMFLKSSVLLTRMSIPDMVERDGRIIFVTSMTTKHSYENFAISGSLRSALISLSKVLSLELAAKKITVNAISQGYVLTDRIRSLAKMNSEKEGTSYDEALEKMREAVPMKRFADPEEVGDLVSFLCSDEAGYITGTNIQIDGGIIRAPF